MRVILLGPPGSGKGTQADLIEKKYSFPKISTGDLLREAVHKGTPLGKKAAMFMNKGRLVSDDVVIALIKERIRQTDCQAGYVLDGFPRNLVQAHALEGIDRNIPEVVIDIQMDEQDLIARLQARRICSRCQAIYNLRVRKPKREGVCDKCGGTLIQREDDKPEVIKERLQVYHEETEKLIDYYSQKRVYHPVDGGEGISVVFHEISVILDRELSHLRSQEARK
ncbi:MAG: adenylate kinase [Candidatus Aminicenantales bacterium]